MKFSNATKWFILGPLTFLQTNPYSLPYNGSIIRNGFMELELAFLTPRVGCGAQRPHWKEKRFPCAFLLIIFSGSPLTLVSLSPSTCKLDYVFMHCSLYTFYFQPSGIASAFSFFENVQKYKGNCTEWRVMDQSTYTKGKPQATKGPLSPVKYQ